ncbi:hypothetical protein [uncultured Kordia sp.]|uniref:hypothetical protein n=1 Tax=uncultured Kordia sp. TaxID=507699 RepID=UPI00261A128C|nr:hypothetical protein [uncultured Kordia sp.]
MSSSTLQAEICIDEVHKGEVCTGYLDIVSTEDILMDEITAKIYFEARGKMSGYKNEVLSFSIITEPILIKAGEENSIPFSFEINDFVESYEGKNVSFTYTCEVMMHVDEEDFKKLGLNFLASVKSFITSDKRLRAQKQFEVADLHNTYSVKEGTYDFKLKLNYILPLAIAVILFLIYISLIPEFDLSFTILGIVILITFTFMIHYYLEDALGRLTMKLADDDDENFHCAIEKTKKINLKEQHVYYEIIEEVVDNRGTSSSTNRQELYKSFRKEMKSFKKNTAFTFPYPGNLSYATMEQKDVKIYWRMCITGVSNLGLKLKYVSEFEVKKNKPIHNKEGLVKF